MKSCTGDVQRRAGSLEDDVGVSSSLSGRDSNVSVSAVVGGHNQSAKINGQVGEVMAYVSAINKLNTLGLPVSKLQK